MLKSFICDDRGTETVEWGIMAGLLVGGVILVIAGIGGWVTTQMTDIDTNLAATTP